MSAPDPETALAPLPEVPSTPRLAWLLYMQPRKLRRMFDEWGWKDGLFTYLRERWELGDPRLRCLLPRLLPHLALWFPLYPLALVFSAFAGISVSDALVVVALSCALYVGWIGVAFSLQLALRLALWMTLVLIVTYYSGVAISALAVSTLTASALSGLALGLLLGTFLDALSALTTGARSYNRHWVLLVLVSMLVGTGLALPYGGASGLAAILAFIGGYLATLYRLYLYPIESLVVARIAAVARDPARGVRAARWLPYRHHDLIRFPLPRLERVFIGLAEHSPNLARQLIDEASTTIAQRRPAQRAFDELQARALRQAAETANWQRVIDLKGNFYPAYTAIPTDDPLIKFITAATDMHAAASGGSQRRRAGLFEKAARQIDEIKRSYLAAPTHDHRASLLHAVADAWSQVIARQRHALTRLMEVDPEIPNVFIVGPPLNPSDPEELQLFRARRDLINIIDRDLDDAQRGVLYLVGQRRMGKTSLLAMLPIYLGTATTIVVCGFQELSGHEYARTPHRWVVDELAAQLSKVAGINLPEGTITDAWRSALAWMLAVDQELARLDHRALVAIDEVEGLQLAVNEGRSDLTFLDFVRAAGDKLRRIRLLLVSAHPLANPKLGPAWVDRLISVLPRTLGPLAPDDAEALLCRPVPTFPEVFDEAAARTILAHTGRHPFLIQAVGKEVVQRLLKDRRRVATAHDVERAIDGVIKIAEGALFTYLWDAFDPAEKSLMRALADGQPVDPETGTFRVLREQWFVDLHDGAPAIAFPLFGRWIRDYRAEHPPR
ncbi:MAG: hypothetical protein JNL82_32680 [Myxococcales bacterium]|nr:hypothetical protein [Myxococcales bacterium]